MVNFVLRCMNKSTLLRAASFAAALYTVRPAFAADVRYPLTTTSDSGTVTDSQRAIDARTLARFVITKERVLKYNPNKGDDSFQSERAVLLTGQWVYTITVENYDEKAESHRSDSLIIEMRRKGKKADEPITLKDIGLDGHCNSGFIPSQFSGKGGGEIVHPASDASKAIEYEALVQRMYTGTLDTLLRLYERR